MKKAILYTGAGINFLMAIFHAMFWPMLNWNEELAKLSKENAAIFQVENIIIITVVMYFAVMSFIIARMEQLDRPARSILILIALFYFLRFVLGYPFFGFSMEEVVIWIVCMIISIAYISILFTKQRIT